MHRIKLVITAVVVIGLTGCQSGPRWAWWKSSAASPAENSLIARTAPGQGLPSAQATPKTITSTTAPTNPAVAVAQTAPPTGPAVPNATVANAPVANYQAALSQTQTVAPSAASLGSYSPPSTPSAGATASNLISAVTAPVTPGAAGPYDPANYATPATRAPATTAQTAIPTAAIPPMAPVSSNRYASAPPTVDRYAAASTNTPASRYAAATETSATAGQQPTTPPVPAPPVQTTPVQAPPTPGQARPLGGRYSSNAMPSAPSIAATNTHIATPTQVQPATPVVTPNVSDFAATSNTPAPIVDTVGTSNITPPVSAVVQTSPAAQQLAPSNNPLRTGVETPAGGLVQTESLVVATAPAGQYRPGGTASYTGDAISVASRPNNTTQSGSSAAPGTQNSATQGRQY